MNLLPTCFLYSQDPAVRQAVEGLLTFMAVVRQVETPTALETFAQQFRPALVMLDLRSDGSRDLLPRLLQDGGQTVLIALGVPNSEPMREAEALGAYAVETLSLDRTRFQTLVRSAQSHQSLLQENLLLKTAAASAKPRAYEVEPRHTPDSATSFRRVSEVFRHFGNLDRLMDRMAEEIAACTRVTRVGFFLAEDGTGVFRFKGGIKCLALVRSQTIEPSDPLLRWLRVNAHVVARTTLGCLPDMQERLLLKQALDWLGADAIAPLYGRDRLLGFLFVGRRMVGAPFEQADVEDLTILSDHLATAIEHALVFERTASQESLMNTVFHTLAVGIVTMGTDREIGLINQAARTILDLPASLPTREAALRLDSRLKSALELCLDGAPSREPVEWSDGATGRHISVSARRLDRGEGCAGAVAIVLDTTGERRLREREGYIERVAFWASMADAVAHEVRNPLVAISTFAQLLPERYEDAEFRREFTQLVTREIERLDGMVKQLDSFASPVAQMFARHELPALVRAACEQAMLQVSGRTLRLETSGEEGLPPVECNAPGLIEAFRHIIVNAMEAVEADGAVPVAVLYSVEGPLDRPAWVTVQFRDSGRGIPCDDVEKVFSPFFTTKPRGLGLGLPIAKRTLFDHRGAITMRSEGKGVCVTVQLPVTQPGRNQGSETHSGRG